MGAGIFSNVPYLHVRTPFQQANSKSFQSIVQKFHKYVVQISACTSARAFSSSAVAGPSGHVCVANYQLVGHELQLFMAVV